jgi:23S rRNA (cytosine1962-C5)-methyltransferase
MTTPIIRLLPRMGRRAAGGHPWIYSNEIAMDADARALPPGGLVTVVSDAGEALGIAMFNPHSLIAARLLSLDAGAAVDADFLRARLKSALDLRDTFYSEPYYRLAHAEADGLPGLIVDRFGDILVVQPNTAGMDRLTGDVVGVLGEMLKPQAVIVRGDSPVRQLEGLDERHEIVGTMPDRPVRLIENGVAYLADVASGQKTGWFYDQRDNRAFMASLADGLDVLDVYCHTGGFGIAAACGDAASVMMVDRSGAACDLARSAAALNARAERCTVVESDAFADLAARSDRAERFGMVICDPPAFVRGKKDLKSVAKGYRKLVRLAARLVQTDGWLAIASCSHHMTEDLLMEQIKLGLKEAKRPGRVVRRSGAGPDHPLHPGLPETAYLKFVCLRLD